jgi:hypothetical protein
MYIIERVVGLGLSVCEARSFLELQTDIREGKRVIWWSSLLGCPFENLSPPKACVAKSSNLLELSTINWASKRQQVSVTKLKLLTFCICHKQEEMHVITCISKVYMHL